MGKSETSSEEGKNPRPWHSYHTVYTNAKAGMDGVDKEKVQRVVYEMSKGSKYFENEERKEAFMKQRIENMRAQRAKLTAADLSHYQMVADKRISELEATRDISRVWLHVDMDAFYAAVETLSNPSLKGKPMAVGSMSMISTANYEARRFGVRAAMPGFIARKLCPQLIFVPTDFKKYTYYSDLTKKVFQRYDPHFMAASLDEAYLDITDVCKERGLASGEIAEELRTRVFEETGLTCSAGVAPNRLLAKVCSDIKKPNGQFVLPNDRMAVMTFISSLPIRKIGGIGKVTEHVLRDALEVNTCEEILQKGGLICALFSHSTADFFLSVGLGLGRTDTPEVKFRKSISCERTFSATDDETLLYEKLADVAEMLCADMQKEGLHGRTLTLKLKTASFEVQSRAVTLSKFICSREDILNHASKLLKAELPISLRLIGLRMSHFSEEKADTPYDRTQKTLTEFLVAEVSRKPVGEQSSLGSDVSGKKFMNDVETSFSVDSHEMHHYEKDPLDSNDLQDLDEHPSIICDIAKVYEPLSNRTAEKMATAVLIGSNPLVDFCQTKVSPSTEAGSSTGQVERGRPDSVIIMHDQVVSSSERNDQLFWMDDYKCSLCGIEMPPDFVVERQEHSDYHLAERLQRDESNTNPKNVAMRQRCLQKGHISSQGKHKRMKPSPREKRHLSIDMFFVKSSQNF